MKKLLKLALLVGGIAAVAKLVAARKSEWTGLTETQVREKLDAKLPDRMPDEKRTEVAEKVVSKMQERGLILEEDGSMTEQAGDVGTSDAAGLDGENDGTAESGDSSNAADPYAAKPDTDVTVDDRAEEPAEST